jgi:hypothetical protein
MRLPGLFIASILFVSPALLAQHSSGAGPVPGNSSSSASSNSSNSSTGNHSSSASSGSSYSGASTAASHSSSASSYSSHSGGPVSRSSTAGVAPASRGVSSSGTGAGVRETTDLSRQVHQTSGPPRNLQPERRGFLTFLRHPLRKPGPTFAATDLRPKGCIGKKCPCPPGETRAKNGQCVASVATNVGDRCVAGERWNGSSCTPRCAANDYWDGSACRRECSEKEYWNGLSCVASPDSCPEIRARAAVLASELRGYKGQMRGACTNNSLAQDCIDLQQTYDGTLLRYRSLLNEAPMDCRAQLPDASTL